MDTLIRRCKRLLATTSTTYTRSLMGTINWDSWLIIIRGVCGIEKTTLMLQYPELHCVNDSQSALYTSLDSLYFAQHIFNELAEQSYLKGGECLSLDEVHKYPPWGKEIKNIYDEFPELRIVLTGSSLLQLLNAETDLSRRCVLYDMQGLSYHEYLKLFHQIHIRSYTLKEILESSDRIYNEVNPQCKSLTHSEGYLKHRYYPFYLEGNAEYYTRIENITNSILEIELPQQCGVDTSNIRKLKNLLGIPSSEVPFMVDITELSTLAKLSRITILAYSQYLDEAKLIYSLYSDNDPIKKLQKPDKIRAGNINLSYVLIFKDMSRGTLRGVSMVNQLAHLHRAEYHTRSVNHTIGNRYTIEVGGRSEDGKQIVGSKKASIAADDIKYSTGNKIPSWVFGFLY